MLILLSLAMQLTITRLIATYQQNVNYILVDELYALLMVIQLKLLSYTFHVYLPTQTTTSI